MFMMVEPFLYELIEQVLTGDNNYKSFACDPTFSGHRCVCYKTHSANTFKYVSQGGQPRGQHDWVHRFPEAVKSLITFVILSQISCGKVQKKPPHIFCTRLCQSFSSICCSFPDYLDQLKKNRKFSTIGYTLQLVKVIWKTAANPGETFTQFCAEKYEAGGGGGGCTSSHEIRHSITKVMNNFPYL